MLIVSACFCGIFLCLCFVIYWLHQQSFEVLGCFFVFLAFFSCLCFVIYWLHQQSFEVLGCFFFVFCGIFLCLCFVIYWLHQQSFEVLGCFFFVFVAFFYVYDLSFIGFTSSPLKFLVVFFCCCGIFLCFVIYWLHQHSFEVLGCFFCFLWHFFMFMFCQLLASPAVL